MMNNTVIILNNYLNPNKLFKDKLCNNPNNPNNKDSNNNNNNSHKCKDNNNNKLILKCKPNGQFNKYKSQNNKNNKQIKTDNSLIHKQINKYSKNFIIIYINKFKIH